MTDGPYFPGMDIARGVVVRADGVSGWVLDSYRRCASVRRRPGRRPIAAYPGRSVMQNLTATLADRVVVVDTYGHRHRSG